MLRSALGVACALGCGEETPRDPGPPPEVTLRTPNGTVYVGVEVEFRALVVDDDAIVEYRFAFGDGTPEVVTTSDTARHVFLAPSWCAEVRATAVDEDGFEGSDRRCVVPYDPKQPIPCGEDDDCPGGFGCAEGACRPADDGGACAPDETDCPGECRDLATDAESCGECGRACEDGESCVLSHCAVPGECAADGDCGADARCLETVCIAIGDVVGSRALPFDGPAFGLAADGESLWALDDPKPAMDLVRFGDEVEARLEAPGLDVGWYAHGLAHAGGRLIYAAYDDAPEASDLVAATPDGALAQRLAGAGGACGEDGDDVLVLDAGGALARLDAATLEAAGEVAVALDGLLPLDLAFDGIDVWVVASDAGVLRLLRVDATAGDVTLDREAPPGAGSALAFDGEWLVTAGEERLYFVAP